MELPVSSEKVSERVQGETWIDVRIRRSADSMDERPTISAETAVRFVILSLFISRKSRTSTLQEGYKCCLKNGLRNVQKNPCGKLKMTIVLSRQFRLETNYGGKSH